MLELVQFKKWSLAGQEHCGLATCILNLKKELAMQRVQEPFSLLGYEKRLNADDFRSYPWNQ